MVVTDTFEVNLRKRSLDEGATKEKAKPNFFVKREVQVVFSVECCESVLLLADNFRKFLEGRG